MLRGIGADVLLVRRPEQLAVLDGIVLPGGESSTIDRLLRMFGIAEPLAARIRSGLPTLGTCAGLILLADEVLDPAPGQQTLKVLDITVRRNAFGPQVDSLETTVATDDGPVTAAFIRAPEVVAVGAGVQVIGRHLGRVVAVRSGAVTGISFHPELTGDTTLHRQLIASARRWRVANTADTAEITAVSANAAG
ncbi:pyridoxal 5'-phosphate synthase glutaminase subunit PdxT [Nakamurella lactea]|uniref:pyridoxal 5'-phosphate synthase glutaminase subunit PdxT n=1 Tax=Nakamurella lactea TaxID=459515 RepID=UPI001B7F79D2